MKRAKKGLAALLSVCMLLSLLPVTVFAEETPAADTLEEAAPAPMEEKGAYDALMQAIEAAPDGDWTRQTRQQWNSMTWFDATIWSHPSFGMGPFFLRELA